MQRSMTRCDPPNSIHNSASGRSGAWAESSSSAAAGESSSTSRMASSGERKMLRRKSLAMPSVPARIVKVARSGGLGKSFKLASTITPSVPKEPVSSFPKIVARNVFHHPAARLGDFSIRGGNFQSQNHIARAAESLAQRPRRVRRDNSADACLAPAARIEGQPQTVLSDEVLKCSERHSRLDRDRQVCRLIMNDAIQFLERQGDVIPPGGIPHRQLRPIAARDQRQMMLACVMQNRSHLFRRARSDGAIRDLAIHRKTRARSACVQQNVGCVPPAPPNPPARNLPPGSRRASCRQSSAKFPAHFPSGKKLSRIQSSLRIEQVLDSAHQFQIDPRKR